MTPAALRQTSGTEPLASTRAARGHHLAPARCRHACAKTVTAFAHQLARLIGPLHGSFSAAASVPIPKFASISARLDENFGDTSKFKVLVRLDWKFLHQVAARPIGTSNPPHHMSMIGSLGRCKGPVSRPSTSGIAAHKISRLIREGGRGRQCEAGPVAQAREGASQDGETALLPAIAR
jgi:hypothetical protein